MTIAFKGEADVTGVEEPNQIGPPKVEKEEQRILIIVCQPFVPLPRRSAVAPYRAPAAGWKMGSPSFGWLAYQVLDGRKGLVNVVWLPGDNAAEPLEQCHGDWAGPIEPPAGLG